MVPNPSASMIWWAFALGIMQSAHCFLPNPVIAGVRSFPARTVSTANFRTPTKFHLHNMRMQNRPPSVDETPKTKGAGATLYFNTPIYENGNLLIAINLIRNQAILGASALYTIASMQADGNVVSLDYSFTIATLAAGLAGALPMCLIGFLISRSPSPTLLDINVGTSMLALKLFGSRRSLPWVTALSSGLGMLTGVCEELSFRGLSLPILAHRLADSGAPPNIAAGFVASSLIFGLAHWSLGGSVRDNLVTAALQTCSGAWFGALYLLSGYNLLVPAVAHAAYDAFTLVEAHVTSTGQVLYARERSAAAAAAGDADAAKLRALAADAGATIADPAALADNARVIFYLADTTRDGRLSLAEVRAAVRQLDLQPSEDLLRSLFRRAAAAANSVGDSSPAGEEGELDLEGWIRFVVLLRQQPAAALRPVPEKRGFLGIR